MSRSLSLSATLILCLTLFPALSTAAPPSLPDVISSEADLVLLIEDLPALRRSLPDLPLVRAWDDPAINRLLVQLIGEDELPDISQWLSPAGDEAATDPHSMLLAQLSGQFAVAMDLKAMDEADDGEEGSGHHLPDGVVFLAQVEGNAEMVRNILGDLAGDDQAGGMTLPEGAWMVENDVLILSGSAQATLAMARGLTGADGIDSLSSTAGFQAMRAAGANPDIEILLDVTAVVDGLKADIAADEADMADNQLGILPEDLYRGLGLEVFQSAWLSIRPAIDVTSVTSGLSFRENRGLIRLAAFKPLDSDQRLPLPANAVDASNYAFDVATAWQALQDILNDVSPILGAAADAQLAQLSAQAGIDLAGHLSGAFTGHFATASFLPPDTSANVLMSPEVLQDLMSEIVVATLNEEHGLDEVMSAIAPFLGAAGLAPATLDLSGRTLNTYQTVDEEGQPLPAGEGESIMGWIIQGQHLVAGKGHPEAFSAVLKTLASGSGGLWKERRVQSALEQHSEGAAALQFQDSGQIFSEMLTMLAGAAEMNEAESAEALRDPELAAAFTRLMDITTSAIYRNSNTLVMENRIIHGTP